MQLSPNSPTASTAVGDAEQVRFVVDGHVHLYSAESATTRVTAACSKLLAQASTASQLRVIPTLLVLDTSKSAVFSSLYNSAPTHGNDGLIRTGDEYGLLLMHGGNVAGMLVGGVQIAAREGFEVLGIGCDISIQDHRAAEDAVADILAADGLPILPWAFGKWFGARGPEVVRVLSGNHGASIMLGDNALRPMPGPRPQPFRLAEDMGKPIFPGSDPLPLDGDAQRIGSYGFEIDGPWSSSTPLSSFLRELKQMRRQPRIIGRRLGWMGSLLLQLRIRAAKPGATLRPAA